MSKKEQLVQRLYEGECSRSELIELLDLVKDSPLDKDVEVMKVLWDRMGVVPETKPLVSKRIRSQITKMGGPGYQYMAPKKERSTVSRRRLMQGFAVAASVLILMVALSTPIWKKAEQRLITVSTSGLDRQEIVLPDGSEVNLNLNSTLSYMSDWTDEDDRVVWLEGEAFLKVKKQNGKKFNVKTKDLTVEVLGTSFNVNCHREETEVYLEEGKIKLHMPDAGIKEMVPGDLLVYSTGKAQIVSERSNSAKELHTGWKDGHLFFRDTPIGEVLQRIEENYAVRIEVLNKGLLKRPISTGVPTANLDTAIAILEKTMGVEIALSEGVLVIN